MIRIQGFRYDRLQNSNFIAASIYSQLIYSFNFNRNTIKIKKVECTDDIFHNKNMMYVEVVFEGERDGQEGI